MKDDHNFHVIQVSILIKNFTTVETTVSRISILSHISTFPLY